MGAKEVLDRLEAVHKESTAIIQEIEDGTLGGLERDEFLTVCRELIAERHALMERLAELDAEAKRNTQGIMDHTTKVGNQLQKNLTAEGRDEGERTRNLLRQAYEDLKADYEQLAAMYARLVESYEKLEATRVVNVDRPVVVTQEKVVKVEVVEWKIPYHYLGLGFSAGLIVAVAIMDLTARFNIGGWQALARVLPWNW